MKINLQSIIDATNESLYGPLLNDYSALQIQLERQGIDIEALTDVASQFEITVPSWGLATGGTRFARFPIPGDPRNIFEKITDAGLLNTLTRANSKISLHFPWDRVGDLNELLEISKVYGLTFDSVNSNTFQNPVGTDISYKYGSLTNSNEGIRDAAINHNLECIDAGIKIGSNSLTVWLPDGSNFPGQRNISRSIDRYLDSAGKIYSYLPNDWSMFLEHKLYEPAFYSTVNCDWGTSFFFASSLGEKAKCLVDLGHHAPNTNIEEIVAKLFKFGKLGGFHFNDSSYGDDDLDAGSVNPFKLFLIFNEIDEANFATPFASEKISYMLDQSHNITDSIESLALSTLEVLRSYIQSKIVNRKELHSRQELNDPLAALECLKKAYRINVDPIIKMSRYKLGGSIDPLLVYRKLNYRNSVASHRPLKGSGAGIV